LRGKKKEYGRVAQQQTNFWPQNSRKKGAIGRGDNVLICLHGDERKIIRRFVSCEAGQEKGTRGKVISSNQQNAQGGMGAKRVLWKGGKKFCVPGPRWGGGGGSERGGLNLRKKRGGKRGGRRLTLVKMNDEKGSIVGKWKLAKVKRKKEVLAVTRKRSWGAISCESKFQGGERQGRGMKGGDLRKKVYLGPGRVQTRRLGGKKGLLPSILGGGGPRET